jgi:hypothetical protein
MAVRLAVFTGFLCISVPWRLVVRPKINNDALPPAAVSFRRDFPC